MVPGVALLMALVALSDGTEAAGARARLVVSGPVHCLTREDLARRVKARSPRVDFTDDAPLVAAVAVTTYSRDAQVVQLDFVRPGQPVRPRVLKTRSCAEAADALALILAVTLDPRAHDLSPVPDERPTSANTPPPAPPVAPPPEPPALAPDSGPPAPSPSPASTRGARAPAPPRRPAAVVKTPAPAPPPLPAAIVPPPTPGPATVASEPPRGGPAQAARHVSFAASADTIFGVAPGLMPGFALTVMFETASEGVWAPAVALRWTHVWRTGLTEAPGTASFNLEAGTVDACPLRWRRSWVSLRPCVSLLVGRLTTRGAGTGDDGGAARPFSTTGLGVQVHAGSSLELTVRLGLGVALVRDSYAFGDRVFYRTGLLTTSAGLGLGFRWP